MNQPEYHETYAPRLRLICSASLAAGQAHWDRVLVGTPALTGELPEACPVCGGPVEVLPGPEAVTIEDGDETPADRPGGEAPPP